MNACCSAESLAAPVLLVCLLCRQRLLLQGSLRVLHQGGVRRRQRGSQLAIGSVLQSMQRAWGQNITFE